MARVLLAVAAALLHMSVLTALACNRRSSKHTGVTAALLHMLVLTGLACNRRGSKKRHRRRGKHFEE